MNLQQLHDYTASLLAGGLNPTLPVTGMSGTDLYELTHFLRIEEWRDPVLQPHSICNYVDEGGQGTYYQDILVLMHVGQSVFDFGGFECPEQMKHTVLPAPKAPLPVTPVAVIPDTNEQLTIKVKKIEEDLAEAIGVMKWQLTNDLEKMAAMVNGLLPHHQRIATMPKVTIVQEPIK